MHLGGSLRVTNLYPFSPKVELFPLEILEEERKIAHGCTAVVREPLIDMSRYGTWLKLIRVTAYVLRAVKLFNTKCKSPESELSVEEVKKAEIKCYGYREKSIKKITSSSSPDKHFPRTVAFSN